jgi:hypothetical protein
MWLRIRTFIWNSVLDGFHDAVKRSVISVVTSLGILGSMTSFYHDNGTVMNVLNRTNQRAGCVGLGTVTETQGDVGTESCRRQPSDQQDCTTDVPME